MPTSFACLILEDDPNISVVLSALIDEQGGRSFPCETLAEAWNIIRKESIDMMVLDQGLPDGRGSDFFHSTRQAGFRPVSIMLTAIPDLPVAVDLMRSGLFDYLAKPFDMSQFLQCLNRALHQLPTTSRDEPPEAMDFQSEAMEGVRALIQPAVQHPEATVLLTGETGVGKDHLARLIHHATHKGQSKPPPFMPVNCATLSADMFEAELFGAEKGSYTGADRQRIGLAEATETGTLFLDEITEMAHGLQAKLLQLLETRSFRRLGGTQTLDFKGRIIAASNRTLLQEVEAGRFRQDLMFRLDVLTMHLPPLRERLDELPGIAQSLLEGLCRRYAKSKKMIRPADLDVLRTHSFPGNIRELRNILERSLLRTQNEAHWLELDCSWQKSPLLSSTILRKDDSILPPPNLNSFDSEQYKLIANTLKETQGAIRETAKRLGISHQALLRRLEKWPELRDFK